MADIRWFSDITEQADGALSVTCTPNRYWRNEDVLFISCYNVEILHSALNVKKTTGG